VAAEDGKEENVAEFAAGASEDLVLRRRKLVEAVAAEDEAELAENGFVLDLSRRENLEAKEVETEVAGDIDGVLN